MILFFLLLFFHCLPFVLFTCGAHSEKCKNSEKKNEELCQSKRRKIVALLGIMFKILFFILLRSMLVFDVILLSYRQIIFSVLLAFVHVFEIVHVNYSIYSEKVFKKMFFFFWKIRAVLCCYFLISIQFIFTWIE